MDIDIYNIPGKLQIRFVPEAKAIVDHWENYSVTLPQFREAILQKALPQARLKGAVAWIVDSTKASGGFAQDIQKLIETEVLPAFVKAGIKYFFPIKSSSAITNMSIQSYRAKVGPSGLMLVEVPTVEDALRWLRSQPVAAARAR